MRLCEWRLSPHQLLPDAWSRAEESDSWLALPVVICGLLLLAGVDGGVSNANPAVFLFELYNILMSGFI